MNTLDWGTVEFFNNITSGGMFNAVIVVDSMDLSVTRVGLEVGVVPIDVSVTRVG